MDDQWTAWYKPWPQRCPPIICSFARTDHVKRLPYFAFPKLWNELPDCKLSSNPITFKIGLKWHLHMLVSERCAWVARCSPNPPYCTPSNLLNLTKSQLVSWSPPLTWWLNWSVYFLSIHLALNWLILRVFFRNKLSWLKGRMDENRDIFLYSIRPCLPTFTHLA